CGKSHCSRRLCGREEPPTGVRRGFRCRLPTVPGSRRPAPSILLLLRRFRGGSPSEHFFDVARGRVRIRTGGGQRRATTEDPMLRAALLVGFAGLLFLVPPPARAALVRVDVVGVIVSVAKDNGVPIPRWSFVVENETPFSAFFVYDDAQTDSDPLAQSGEFVYEGSPFFYQVEVGPYLFATDAFLL